MQCARLAPMMKLRSSLTVSGRQQFVSRAFFSAGDEYDTRDLRTISIPPYQPKDSEESVVKKRARLTWQSRKRGIKENCLIFGTFADEHLANFSIEQLSMYDDLLNKAENDWEMYYWMVGAKDVPERFDNEVMKMLQIHCRNDDKAERFEQPALNYEPVENT